MSAVTGLSIFAQRRIVHRRGAPTVTGRGYRIRPLRLGRMRPVAHCACFAYVLLSFVIPAIALVYTSLIKFFVANPFDAAYTLRNYQQILDSPGTVRAFWNTLIVSGGGALLGLLLGTLIAYSTHRLKPRGYRALDILASLPFGIPGIVIGLGFLWSYVYLPIYGTLWVLVFCYVARFLPYATETIGAQVVQLDQRAGGSRLGFWRASHCQLSPDRAAVVAAGVAKCLFPAVYRLFSRDRRGSADLHCQHTGAVDFHLGVLRKCQLGRGQCLVGDRHVDHRSPDGGRDARAAAAVAVSW